MVYFNKNTLDNVVDFFKRALKDYPVYYYTYNYDNEFYERISTALINCENYDFEIFVRFDKYEYVYKVYIKQV